MKPGPQKSSKQKLIDKDQHLLEAVEKCTVKEELQKKIDEDLVTLIRDVDQGQLRAKLKHIETLDAFTEVFQVNEALQVPFTKLIHLYLKKNATEAQQRYSLRFIRLGFPRMLLPQKVQFIETAIKKFVDEEKWCQDALLILIVKLLNATCTTSYRGELHPCHHFRSKTIVKSIFLQYLLDILMLPYEALPTEFTELEETEEQCRGLLNKKMIPNGISESSYRKLIVNGKLTTDEIEDCKLGIVKFIFNEVFDLNDFFLHVIVAVCDPCSLISDMANDKKYLVYNHMDWESEATADLLYSLYRGEESNFDETQKELVNRTAPNSSIKVEILRLCTRLKYAALKPYQTLNFLLKTTNFRKQNANPEVQTKVFEFVEYWINQLDLSDGLERVSNLWTRFIELIRCERESPEMFHIHKLVRLMVARFPSVVFGKLDMVRVCFDQLETASGAFADTVAETLLAQIDTLQLDVVVLYVLPERFEYRKSLMENLFIDLLKSSNPRVRLTAMQFLREIFGFGNIRTTFAFLQLGMSDEASDADCVRNAFNYLYGADRDDVIGDEISFRYVPFPDPIEMVNYTVDMLSQSIDMESRDAAVKKQNGKTLSYYLTFLRFCLLRELDEPLTYKIRPIPSICTSGVVKAYVKYRLDNQYSNLKFRKFASFCEYYAECQSDLQSMRMLTEVAASGMPFTSDTDVEKASWNKHVYNENAPEFQDTAITLLANIYVSCPLREFESKIRLLLLHWRTRKKENLKANVLVCARALERWKFRRNGSNIDAVIVSNVVQELTKLIYMSDANERQLSSVIDAVILLSQSAVILRMKGGNAAENKQKLLKALLKVMSDAKQSEAIHKQIMKVLSVIGVAETQDANRQMIETLLSSAITPKLVEFKQMLEVAELLVQCVAGRRTSEIFDSWKFERNRANESRPTRSQSVLSLQSLVNGLVSRLQSQIEPQPNPNQSDNVKKALVVCCLYMFTSFSHENEVRRSAALINELVVEMFVVTDVIMLEIVSKVLHRSWRLVTDSNTRIDLINRLCGRISKLGDEIRESQNYRNVIYHPDFLLQLMIIVRALPVTGLIYSFIEFMCEAGVLRGAKWQFQPQEPIGRELRPHIAQVVTTIFRYRFNLDRNMRRVMEEVWKNMVEDTPSTLLAHYELMMTTYLTVIEEDIFIHRCTSCEAIPQLLAELKKHIPITRWRPFLPRIWKKILPTYEDVFYKCNLLGIPESLQILSNLTINDATRNPNDPEVLNMVKLTILVLVEKNFSPYNFTIKSFLLTNIHCLMNLPGQNLKPIMHELVPKLANLMTITEPSPNETLEQGKQRLAAQFQQMEAVNDYFLDKISDSCRPHLDNANFGTVLEKLIKILELNEEKIELRIAVADLISNLVPSFLQSTQPHVECLVRCLEPQIDLNRPILLSKSCAKLLGHLLKLCSAETVANYLEKLKQLFFTEIAATSVHQVLPVAIKSIVDHSPSVYSDNIYQILSIIYLAKFQPQSKKNTLSVAIWQEMWEVYKDRNDFNIRCLIGKCLNVITHGLGQSTAIIKTAAARALFEIVSKRCDHLDELWTTALVNLMFVLMDEEWYEDKYLLLNSLKLLFVKQPERFQNYYETQRNIIGNSLLKETAKHNTEYKMYVFDAACRLFQVMKSTRYADVLNHGWVYLIKPFQHIKDETEYTNEERLRSNILACLKVTWPLDDDVYQEEMLMQYLSMLLEATPVLNTKLFNETYEFFEYMYKISKTLQASRIVNNKVTFFQEFTGRLASVMTLILIDDRPYPYVLGFIEKMLANQLVLQQTNQLEGLKRQLMFLREQKDASFKMHAYLVPQIDTLINRIENTVAEPDNENEQRPA